MMRFGLPPLKQEVSEMTHAELEALENGARVATVYEAGLVETPLPRKIVNGLTGLVVLVAAAIVLLFVVMWRAH